MELNLDENAKKLLEQLASEDAKTVEELIAQLIKQEDEKRHVVWSRKSGFVRRRCPRIKCFETATISDKEVAD